MSSPNIVGEAGWAAYVADVDAARTLGAALAGASSIGEVAVHVDIGGDMALLRATGDLGVLEPAFRALDAESLHVTATRSLLRHRVRWPMGDPTPGIGTIFGVRRRPGWTADQFHQHWEHSHGPVALAHHLGMWDYRQVSVVDTVRGAPLDGIAVVQWPNDEDRRTRFFDDERGAAIVDADASTFTDRAHLHHHLMTEQLLRTAPLPAAGSIEITDHRSLELPVPAADLWTVIGDFGAILDWWPSGVVACDVDDSDQPTTRVLSGADGSTVTERLVHHRPAEHMFMLDVIHGFPSSVDRYTCRYEIRQRHGGGCRLDWQPRATIAVDDIGLFERIVDQGWAQIAEGLSSLV